MKKIETINEINLLEIFHTIMNNKKKILLIVILSMTITFGFQVLEEDKVKHGQAQKITTKITAVSMFDEGINYRNINLKIGSQNLNRIALFELFIETLKAEIRTLLVQSNIVKKENYKDDKAYKVALNKIVSKVLILENKNERKNREETEVTLEFSSQNKNAADKWLEIINILEYSINKRTQEHLKYLINKKLKYDKIIKQNKIEDIDREIENAVKFYLLKIDNRLSFLEEQAKIAREGNIDIKAPKKIILTSYPFNHAGNTDKENLSQYYMKGYRVIEKEIALIKRRKNPYLFVKEMPGLELKKIELEGDPSITRKEADFKKTAIFSDSKFKAGLVDVYSTEMSQTKHTSLAVKIIIAGLIGMIIGIFYVLISSAINSAMKRH